MLKKPEWAAPLIAAQLLFAYAFDMLLNWSRRDTYTLGFGPFPIILSTNLFLWFRAEWFYLQFPMIAVGFEAEAIGLPSGPVTCARSTTTPVTRSSRAAY